MSGRVIAITGAASGIGLATARLSSSRGIIVSLADYQEKALTKIVEKINGDGACAIGTVVDVRDKNHVSNWIRKTVERYGRLDGAANIAGISGRRMAPIQDLTDEEWDRVININQRGIFNCLRAQVPYLNNGASVVNSTRIRCNVICPGRMGTQITKAPIDSAQETNLSHIPMATLGHPDKVAHLNEWLISPRSSYVTGSVSSIDGGWTC
ncbi:hypothetical protein COCVIDRAFT_42566 [Bipolaris victoriae FI3]|uniref:Uncharacterized protein n=1 Tax=Bipolaris victoriae (strain FI3) TaxID=930091 RepID=W7DZI2_BIPV3|nr:hypothetical protein COCVIDRAFT_42566 [Bipolaris victoriae FI3]